MGNGFQVLYAIAIILKFKVKRREVSMEDFIKNLHEPTNLAVFFCICSFVAYAVTEIVKPFARKKIKSKNLRTSAVRLLACIVGGLAGYQISKVSFGMWIGFSSGATNATVIALLKARLKSVENEKNASAEEAIPNKSEDTDAPL